MGEVILEHIDQIVEASEWIIGGDTIHFARVKSTLITKHSVHPNPFAPTFTLVSQG